MYTRYTCQMPVTCTRIFSSSTTTTTTLLSYKTTKVPGIQHYNYNYDNRFFTFSIFVLVHNELEARTTKAIAPPYVAKEVQDYLFHSHPPIFIFSIPPQKPRERARILFATARKTPLRCQTRISGIHTIYYILPGSILMLMYIIK